MSCFLWNISIVFTSPFTPEGSKTTLSPTFNTPVSILTTGKEMTATEVAERHEEKMIMLGPVIERMQAELHDPILERTFSIMSDIGMLPPAPPELQGVDLKIEYISLLAQAQKLVGTGAIERVAGFVSTVGQAIPQTLDKFNADEAVDQYAEMVGVPPNVIRTNDEVAQIREQRAQQQQQQQQMEAAERLAQTSKTLADTKMDENSALDAVKDLVGGEA